MTTDASRQGAAPRAVARPRAAVTELSSKRLLVVLEGGLDALREPTQSALLARAVEVARSTTGELELFQVCTNPSFIRPHGSRAFERSKTMTAYAARLAELAAWLRPLGIRASHDVRWDRVAADAIARKITDSSPDLVLKGTRRDSHVHGPMTPTDHRLVASIDVPLWLTRHSHRPLEAVSVGVRAHLTGAEIDHAPLRLATSIASSTGATLHVVHGCESADSDVARRCRRAARAFERSTGRRNVVVGGRDTREELAAAAITTRSALVIIGVDDVEHLDPTTQPRELEPSLAQVPCDVLITCGTTARG